MDWLAHAAENRPDAPAIVFGDRTISYADLDRAANAVAGMVLGAGLEGSGVAFWGERDPATVAAVWGVCRAGSVAVPVDSRLPPAEAMRLTRDAGVRGLFPIPEEGIDALLDRRAPDETPAWGPPDPSSRFVVFTSGSEGAHRGVILTGENISAAVAGSRERLGNGPDDAWLCVLPLFHVGGLSILWRQAEQGAPVALESRFDPARIGRLLGTAAFSSLVPTMLQRVLDAGPVLGSGRVLVGGGPADPSLLRSALEAGVPALQTYGLTETASQVTTVAPGDEETDLGTAGRPIPGAEVRIAEGRIEVRGPMVTPGYLGEPEREPGSWFTTGDLGEIDGRGRLTVIGRADSVIVTGGENVHPTSVERALRSCPGVVDARVFGVADDEWGRRVVAEVVLDGVGVAEVREWVASRLTPSEIPKEWRTVEKLPGKLEG
ncbi:MAG TPA: AMP-binding protein [Acidimicrobiia bacterium]|nr:AMP-binding protein [Acidimicrobiia bacterium]